MISYEYTIEESWRYIRSCRHAPPAFASKDKNRKLLFNASLEQSEQFFRASDTAGYEIKPILQYYGLNQAGRAIAAAGLDPSEPWTYRGHGLRCPNISNNPEIGDLELRGDKGTSAFSTLAHLLGSPGLAHVVTMRELWASLPEGIAAPFHDSHETWRAARIVSDSHTTNARGRWAGSLLSVPGRLRTFSHQDLEIEVFAHFPTLAEQQITIPPLIFPELFPVFDKNEHLVQLVRDVDSDETTYLNVAYAVGYRSEAGESSWLIPCLAGNSHPLHTMATWWAILFALSMLARYEPSSWAKHLDISSSPNAAAIEHILDRAHQACANLIRLKLNKQRMVAAGWPPSDIRG